MWIPAFPHPQCRHDHHVPVSGVHWFERFPTRVDRDWLLERLSCGLSGLGPPGLILFREYPVSHF